MVGNILEANMKEQIQVLFYEIVMDYASMYTLLFNLLSHHICCLIIFYFMITNVYVEIKFLSPYICNIYKISKTIYIHLCMIFFLV